MKKEEVDHLRHRAGRLVQKAIKNGTLSPITRKTACVDCGAKATCYDHRDYYQPLMVEPVCRKCNTKRGAAHPIPTDWKENNGYCFNNFEGGEGDEPLWFNGHCIKEPNERLLDIHDDYYSEFRHGPNVDPDLRIMAEELHRLQWVRKEIRLGKRKSGLAK